MAMISKAYEANGDHFVFCKGLAWVTSDTGTSIDGEPGTISITCACGTMNLEEKFYILL